MTASEVFALDFHTLEGKTIGEKRKNLFTLLNSTTNANEIDFGKVKPRNFLEEKFKVDLLLHFKRTTDLIEILKSERSLQIQRILKRSQWFVEQIFSSTTPDELTATIFPNTSFRTKVKLINKLAIYLDDSNKAHEYFEAINKQYGAYLASKLLPSCRADYIITFLSTRHFKPTPKQALTIIKRYPESTTELVDILMTFYNAREEYTNVFDYLKLHDVNLLLKLNEEHRLGLRLGWRTTDKYVHLHSEQIINDPQKYYKILHKRQIAKSLHRNFNALYINLFPKDLDDFRDEFNRIILVLKQLPKSMRQGKLLVDNYTKLYGTSFWNSSYVSLEILEMLTADEREEAMQVATRPENILETKWISYLKTDKSIPMLKKQISLSSQVGTRANLVQSLVTTCKINMDDAAFLNVCNYMLGTHRNDHIRVRKSFLNAIKENYDLDQLSEEHWKCVNEFISIFELNDESTGEMFEFKKCYVRYRLLHDLPVKDQLVQWVRTKNIHFNIFNDDNKLQAHCFNLFAEIISKELKDEDLTTSNISLLENVANWNKRKKNEKMSLFTFGSAVQSLKDKITKNDFRHRDITILSTLIKEECKAEGDRTMFNIYLSLDEKYGNVDILTWLIQNDPCVVDENIDAIIEVFLNSFYSFYKEYYFFKHIKNYSQILKKAVNALSNPQKVHKQKDAIITLSLMQKPEDFIKLIKEYYPTDLKADPRSEASRELYALQEMVARCLKNLDPPSTAMPSILKFCKGDYLKLIRAALYSICDNVNEVKLIPFLSELIDQAVSIRKHALHLTFRVLDKNQVYTLIRHFMEKETNDSVKKFIFKGCFNFFVKNPDEFTWELVLLNLNSVDIDDTEAVEVLLQFDKVPMEYRCKYVVLTWDVLNKVPDPNNTHRSNLNNLLNHISVEMVPTLPQEFYDKVISAYFFKDSCEVTWFGSCVNAFVCKYILCSSSDDEKRERLDATFAIIKDNMLSSRANASDRPFGYNNAIDFLKEFCLPFMKDECNELVAFEQFASLWNDFFQPHESFDEYLHLKFVALYMESLQAFELGSKLGELCDSLVNTYGDVIVGMLCNKINFFSRYFFKDEDEDDPYNLIDGLISNSESKASTILGILLLSNNAPSGKRAKRKYDEIVEKLEKVDNPTVVLYLCSLFSENVKLHYKIR